MKHIIAGTAGHIDHGKTALVRALTGVETDRLKEEKLRGISIDIGFAHLQLAPDLRLGFVDVPGHERFIKNMLAGAAGVDFVLLAIAADESIKPQTREHFEICRLLGIRRGIVVLTKADLAGPDLVELTRLEADEFVKGSFLEGAPIVAVSSTTGQGLDELRACMLDLGRSLTSKDSTRYFRLPVDRSFSMRGFGTVVTGTLISGSVSVDDEVEVLPDRRRLRVRGVQVHGETAARAIAGQRTALNLAGAEAGELTRGRVLTEPGRFVPTSRFDCIFQLLPGANRLKQRAPVHFHAGTAELQAEVRWLDRDGPLEPGSRAYARVTLKQPLLLLPGDRFIVRRFSPVVTIGGGVVLDPAPPRRANVERLVTLERGSHPEQLGLLVGEAPFGMGMPEIIARTGWLTEEIKQAAEHAPLAVFHEPQYWVTGAEWLRGKLDQIQSVLKQFHRSKPLLAGMPKEELRGRELSGAPPFLLDAMLQRAKTVVAEGETVRLASHRVSLREDEQQATEKIENAFRAGGLSVPAVADVLKSSGIDAARARTLLQILLNQRKLIKVNDDFVFHHSALEALRQVLSTRRGTRFQVSEFKDWTGISRKYAIPLLEYLDREHVTRREGESRIVL